MSPALDILARLDKLNAIGRALSAETDLPRLLEAILLAAKDFAHADGGTLYRMVNGALQFEALRNDSLGFAMGGTTGTAIPFPPIPLQLADGRPNQHMVVAHAALSGQTVNIADAYSAEGFDFSGTRAFDARTGYRSQSFLTVPMKSHDGSIIGVLQLINAQDEAGQIRSFTPEDQQLVESLASQAAIALNNRLLIQQLEQLFEALINLINAAIDEKSPYTGGHCERVPLLTMMLADAAHQVKSGPLADFHMSEQDRYELKIAGLLHDCGKITTPVHVVDKATKLETIFDRIALVDTRFEVLFRDAEIALLKGEMDEAAYTVRIHQLENDRELLRATNIGGEYMDEAHLRAVETIAAMPWRDHDGKEQTFLSSDELTNLSVRRGTLNEAERNIINHHIVMTIRLLEALPWPAHLARVPEYAGGHHERMDGRGYPRGLTREQMSVQARIMGIADIFEALTARDRPYKPGKPLSESLTILGRMARDQHIDNDLFDVFMRERVYLRYAEQFLEPSQLDHVDPASIPGWSGSRC